MASGEIVLFSKRMMNHSFSLEEMNQLGEKLYSEKLREVLERDYMGQYAVVDVEIGDYVVDPDRLIALDKATKKFGDKLFYIVQIGTFQHPGLNYSAKKYAWDF